MRLRPASRVQDLQRTLIRRIFDAAPPDSINLGLGQPDLPTPSCIALGGIAAVAAGHTGYTSTAGLSELREAIARRYSTAGVTPDGVLVTVGSQEAMCVATLGLIEQGDEVLVPDPGYPAYPTVVRLAGGVPVTYPLSARHGFRPRAADLEPLLGPRTRLVVLTLPSNPTGALATPAELTRIVALLRERGVAWLSDEVYSGYRYVEPCPSPLEMDRDGGLLVSGLSKDFSMTGWRIGWVIGPPELVPRLTALHQHLVTCAPHPSQRAALVALAPEGAREAARQLEVFRHRRRLMAAELERIPGIRFEKPDGAFYYFVDVSARGDDLELARRLLERYRVITIPGQAFGPGGRGYLRISFAAPDRWIVEGLRALARVLGETD